MSAVVLLKEAIADIKKAHDFYEWQSIGLGDRFVDSIHNDLSSLETLHGFHNVRFGLHRMFAKRFPFGIYYRECDEVIQVFAVLDLRRDPDWIREELLRR